MRTGARFPFENPQRVQDQRPQPRYLTLRGRSPKCPVLNYPFSATVCGLTCAVASLIVSKVRSGWYGECLDALESLMTCVLDKAAEARKAGVELPANYDGDPMEEFKQMDRAAKAQPATAAAAGAGTDAAADGEPAAKDGE